METNVAKETKENVSYLLKQEHTFSNSLIIREQNILHKLSQLSLRFYF